MRKMFSAACLVLALSSPAAADEPTPLKWPSHTSVPQRISDAAVGVNLGMDAWRSLVRTDARQRWGWACRTGLALGTVEILKRVIRRERPDGSDHYSSPSGHTAMSVVSHGHGYMAPLGASMAVTVAWGRQAGGKHYATDVAMGAGIGWVSQRVCPGRE